MDFDWEVAVKGIQLLFGVQLVILAAAKFVYGSQKQVTLAIICLITSMWFFRKFFWGVWQEYDLLIVLIGGSKEVFLAPLLLTHLRVMRLKINWMFIFRHFSIPTAYYLFYLIHRIGFNESYATHNYQQAMFYFTLNLVLFVFYFVLCIREFKLYLNPLLILKARKKHYLFTMLTFMWYLPGPVMSALYRWDLEVNSQLSNQLYLIGANFYAYFFDFYFYAITIYLLVYALTETRYFKNLFLAKDIAQKTKAPAQQEVMAELIERHFYKDKIFLAPDFTAEVAAKTMGCSKRELTEYLKEHQHSGFAEFINRLKVEEFKSLIALEENQVYDMVSVAEKAGFKSKATFNRVFKQLEGITPREYRKKLEGEHPVSHETPESPSQPS